MSETVLIVAGSITVMGLALFVLAAGADAVWVQCKAGKFFVDMHAENRRLKAEIKKLKDPK